MAESSNCLTSLRNKLKERQFWIGVSAEFLGTLIFVFVVCGSTLAWPSSRPTVLHIALTVGLTVATLVMAIGHITGGQINPAVSLALVTTKRLHPVDGVAYIVCQFIGGVLGASLLYGLTPASIRGSLGVTAPASNVGLPQAVTMETFLTFLLVFSIYAATDREKAHKGYEIPLAIGFCVFICHMVGIPFTGCSMNPARSFGPAMVMNSWTHHWVYWVGPCFGAIIAGFLYDFVFAKRTSVVSPTVSHHNGDIELR